MLLSLLRAAWTVIIMAKVCVFNCFYTFRPMINVVNYPFYKIFTPNVLGNVHVPYSVYD